MSLIDTAMTENDDLDSGLRYCVEVWDWIRPHIHYVKFRNRVVYAKDHPHIIVKFILMEYNSSWRAGDSAIRYFVPGTEIETDCLQRDNYLLDYLNFVISERDSNVEIYSRRKIVNGRPHRCLRQLVVKFNVETSKLPRLPDVTSLT